MNWRGHLTRLPGLLVAALLAASACAGGAGQQAAPKGPIKIGLLTSLTGNYAPLGKNDKLAAEQMVNQINARGGINGRKIQLIEMDDASDPNQTVIDYGKLVDQGVVAIEGPPQSTSELAMIPQVDIKKIPDVSVAASDQQVMPVHPYVWMTTPTSKQVAATCLKFMQQQGWTKLAMLTDTKNAYAVAGHDETKQLASSYGVSVIDDETFELGQTDFSPQIARVQAAHPDVLLTWATGAPPVVITKQWAAAKTGIPLMMTAAEASSLYLQPTGAAAEGVYVEASMGVVGASLPASNKYKKLIDEFAGPFQKANGYYPPQFAWDSMIAMTFIFDAIKRKGATPEGIRAGLDSINLDTPQGHYRFTGQKHWGMPDSASLMSVVKNGQFVPVGLTEQQLAQAGNK
ncbi:MAG TPA: ABC transporter substrate-binding protein [Candidatus Dormibacteraeota bacterium]|nr:ABC transporter substrate-binding protein [Candidatus Dormibacteraeota bacterium]